MDREENTPFGLTSQEVAERVEKGQVNKADISTGKSTKEIIRSNVLTYFNLIFLIIAVLLTVVGSFRNLTFLPIIIGNTLIGIIQGLRAKKTLDKMSLLNAPHAQVIRDGKQKRVTSDELVKDDVVLLRAGDQICADAVVSDGAIQVNESLLTGESDEISKTRGDSLLSGSFVVSGQCYARLEKVGNESYISHLTAEAKAMAGGEQSEMIRSINKIIKWVGIAIIPIGIILFCQGMFVNHETFARSVTSTVAAIIGMIPEGLYLLTTIALALSTIRLAKRQVLLHDMKSIETLARVDVLCVDKTGTITEPEMCVKEIVTRRGKGETLSLLSDYVYASNDTNATMQALREYIAANRKENAMKRTALDVFPFSSSVKYGAVTFSEGTFLLGAPEFVLRDRFGRYASEIATYTEKGYRVLLFASYEGDAKHGLKGDAEPLAYIVLSNPIRKNAKETFGYFKEQGVAIKVISGDNPATVAEISRQAGIDGADNYVDAATLDTPEKLRAAAERYTVFGRVTPKQKQKLVRALQSSGHTVAMTGDGVNDILAMKDADCSVAMSSGSEAAAQVAQVVLLDSDFARMPSVVLEGRQVVNNIQRSAALFLVKNIFSFLMAIFSAVFFFTYPFEPAQISLISMFTIGLPGFLLALEPNKERIKGHFMKNVMMKAFPAGLTDTLAIAGLVVCGTVFSLPQDDISTAGTMLLAVVGFMILVNISKPFNKLKLGIVVLNIALLLFCGIVLKDLFAISGMSWICVLLLAVFSLASATIFRILTMLSDKIAHIQEKREEEALLSGRRKKRRRSSPSARKRANGDPARRGSSKKA